MSIEFNCFPIYGYRVDQAANILLKDITALRGIVKNGKNTFEYDSNVKDPAVLDSYDYRYGIMGGPDYTKGKANSKIVVPELVEAIDEATAKA